MNGEMFEYKGWWQYEMAKVRLADLCVYLFWGILMGGKGMAWDSSNSIFHALTIFGIVLASLKILTGKYSYKALLTCTTLMILGGLSYLYTGDDVIFVTFITVIAFKGEDIEKNFRWSFWCRLIPFIIRIALYILGFLHMEGVYTEAGSTRLRYAFGFTHPNLAQNEFFVIFILYYLGHKGKISKPVYVIALIIDLFLFRYTKSRTTVVCLILLLVLDFMCQYNKPQKIVKKIAPYLYPGMAIFSFVFAEAWPYIESSKILGGTALARFQTSYHLLDTYTFNLFGTVSQYTTDNGYVNTFCNFGLVFFLLFIIGNVLLMNKCIKDNKMYIVIVLVTIAVGFTMERYHLSILLNCSLLYFSPYLFENNSTLGCRNR